MKKLLTILILISYNLLFSAHEAIKYNPEANCPQTPDLLRLEAPIKEACSKAYRKYVAHCKQKVEQAINCSTLTKDLDELLKSYTCISYSQWQKNGRTLVKAAWAGKIEVINGLLESGEVDIDAKNKWGETALMRASHKRHNDIAELLIKVGADIEIKNSIKATSLIFVSFKGYKEIAELLIKAGANIEAKDKWGHTALMWASFKGFKEIVELLIKSGADVDVKDNYGDTALMWVSWKGYKEIAELLVKAGANVDDKNNKGDTALIHTTNPEIEKLLKSHSKEGCIIL